MPRFFNYPELIKDGLNNLGYEVDFFDDRPSTNAWVKAAIRINKNMISKYIGRYFEEVMKTVKKRNMMRYFLFQASHCHSVKR